MKFRLSLCLMLACATSSAFGQPVLYANKGANDNTAVLPIRNSDDGKIFALMLIEPSSTLPQLPSQRVIRPANASRSNGMTLGNGLQLHAGLSLEANPGLGVLCANQNSITSVGALAGNCMLTDFGQPAATGSRNAVNGLLNLQSPRTKLTASLGLERETLGASSSLIGTVPADRHLLSSLLGPGSATLDQRNASLIGQVSLGEQGWVSIGGTLAHVRLINTNQLYKDLPPEWNSGSFTLSGGVGRFGGEITGQMIEVPGQFNQYRTIGAGVTWHTKWGPKLSVGADNLISRGKNPFGLPDANVVGNAEEGRIPYVRYQQDL